MSKLTAFVVEHRVAIVAWLVWGVDVLDSWLTAGQPINTHTFFLALVTGLATKRPGDATKKQVNARLEVARRDSARAARISSVPPAVWREGIDGSLPDEQTPLERHKTGGMQ